MKILMCRPEFYDIFYEINPWMNKNHHVSQQKAKEQWMQLKDTLEKCGADISLVAQAQGFPDMVFTANAGIVFDHKVLLARFKFPERQGEYRLFREWFLANGYEVIPDLATDFKKNPPQDLLNDYEGPCCEGEGDALFSGRHLFVGHGFRSDPEYYARFETLGLRLDHLVYCQLIDPYFYHLDTCFCPLDEKQAIWWPGAFSEESQKEMARHLELIAIPEEDAKKFACNAVVIGKKIVIPAGCTETRTILEKRGFSVFECEMSEYIKAGGACKCLTLILSR